MISGRFTCGDCKQIFKDNERLQVHRISFLPTLNEICDICQLPVPNCITKASHMQTHPICMVCNKCFISRDKYLLHYMTNHPGSVPKTLTLHVSYGAVSCFVCGFIFSDTALADIHVRAFHPVFLAIFRLKK